MLPTSICLACAERMISTTLCTCMLPARLIEHSRASTLHTWGETTAQTFPSCRDTATQIQGTATLLSVGIPKIATYALKDF